MRLCQFCRSFGITRFDRSNNVVVLHTGRRKFFRHGAVHGAIERHANPCVIDQKPSERGQEVHIPGHLSGDFMKPDIGQCALVHASIAQRSSKVLLRGLTR